MTGRAPLSTKVARARLGVEGSRIVEIPLTKDEAVAEFWTTYTTAVILARQLQSTHAETDDPGFTEAVKFLVEINEMLGLEPNPRHTDFTTWRVIDG